MKLANEIIQTVLDTLHQCIQAQAICKQAFEWDKLKNKLLSNLAAIQQIHAMQVTGGAPNVVAYDNKTNSYTIMDCSIESPKGRRSWCYDLPALEARKEHKPEQAAMAWCEQHKLSMLDESDYKFLQSLQDFDLKTSSWLLTPDAIRKHGGAIFGDKRYGHTFIYHNGASSYYASRGFRTKITI